MRDNSEWYTMTKKGNFKELFDTEMFKIKIGESQSIIHEVFHK